MDFLQKMKAKAKENRRYIVLPESMEERTLAAAEEILKEDFAHIILLGKKEEILTKGFDVERATFINSDNYDMDSLAVSLHKIRESKGLTLDKAKDLLKDPLYLGVMLVKEGRAHGMVAGAINATPDVLRPSLQIIKTAPGVQLVSTFFVMTTDLGTFIFSDCGLVQSPNAEELASIAYSSAKNYEALIGGEARVAMLSHSTMGSAKHADVDKVVNATKIAKEKFQITVDGEMQVDAAISPKVGQLKAPDSSVAGKANVLIFPDLDAANIGYKLVQYFGNASALGPITQGLAKPINDLSRGCTPEDIIGVAAVTAVQAGL